MVIQSVSNEQVKKVIQLKEKAKIRRTTGQYVVEGMKMFREVPKEDIVRIYASETFQKQHFDMLTGYKVQPVCDRIFCKMSDTVTPQGILVVAKQKKYRIGDMLATKKPNGNCFMILENIRDPGNLGTIIRTGEGAGISGIIMNRGCVDIYSPKVIRSTMGSIFRVPFVVTDNQMVAIEQLKSKNITVYAMHLQGREYHGEPMKSDCAFMIGNEAEGLSLELSALADHRIKIPMDGQVESLNASVAASILMYLHKLQR